MERRIPGPDRFAAVKIVSVELLKNMGAVGVGLLVAFLTPVRWIILLLVCLIGLDFFAGIRAAKALKIPVTSVRMRRSADKFVLYTATIIMAHGLELIFFEQIGLPLMMIVSFFLCQIEFFSLLENVEKATGIEIRKKLAEHFTKFIKK